MMAQLRIDFQGRGKVQTFSWVCVQPMGNGIQLTLGIARQVCALGQVLAQQPIVFSLVPRCQGLDGSAKKIRIASRSARRACSAISFPRRTSMFCAAARALRISVSVILARMTSRVVRSTCVPTAGPLRAPLVRSPSQWPGTVRVGTSAGRAVMGVMLAIWSRRLVPRARGCCALRSVTQRGQQFAAQAAAGPHIQARIDGLSRQLLLHVVRIRALEPPRNLLGRVALGQMRPHVLPQSGILQLARPTRLTDPSRGQRVRGASPIGAPPRVAGPLTAHGAGRSLQHPRHRPQRLAVGQAQTQGFTFFGTHVFIGFRMHGNTLAHPGL